MPLDADPLQLESFRNIWRVLFRDLGESRHGLTVTGRRCFTLMLRTSVKLAIVAI